MMVERGPYVSFANCGLPYHVGGVIEHESDLLVASPELFRGHFRVDCRTGCEAIGISSAEKTVELRDQATGAVSTESYDKLVLSPGAASIRPPLPGIDLPGIFAVRTVPDAREIRQWIERGTGFLTGMGKYSGFQTVRPPTRAVVIGGGFIGLETAENLVFRGFDVTVVEMADQVLAPLDPEYGRLVGEFLEHHGVDVVLGDGVAGFERSEDDTLTVTTQSGQHYPADVVILALGVRPDTTLARMAGIEIGELGGIRVDEHMRTSDPDIFAVGDAVEVRDFVTGEWSLIALAGPANRQARIAAEVIVGRDSRFRGTQGTAVVGLFGSTVAWTGANEKTLERLGDSDFEKVYLYPNSHAGYYPGAKPIAMNSCSASPTDASWERRPSARTGWTSGSASWLWRSSWARRCTTSRSASCATRPRSAARRTRSTSPGWSPPGCSAATCPSRIGTPRRTDSCSTCARGSSRRWSRCPKRSPSHWASCAHASTSSRATVRSTSSAAPGSVPTTPPGSCCRKDWTRRSFPGVCSRTRSSRRQQT